ncbi:hypothetical protein CDAR_459791 [Caerostris darwini]|uniref:Uncharacterized protein n=1 Tax=Caerostris darwini TaxID=1538125 RepID=A0AAV4MF48_9ARAC|nr:hypothetical protein CDAR_459791 [Caerostris darwini]
MQMLAVEVGVAELDSILDLTIGTLTIQLAGLVVNVDLSSIRSVLSQSGDGAPREHVQIALGILFRCERCFLPGRGTDVICSTVVLQHASREGRRFCRQVLQKREMFRSRRTQSSGGGRGEGRRNPERERDALKITDDKGRESCPILRNEVLEGPDVESLTLSPSDRVLDHRLHARLKSPVQPHNFEQC